MRLGGGLRTDAARSHRVFSHAEVTKSVRRYMFMLQLESPYLLIVISPYFTDILLVFAPNT